MKTPLKSDREVVTRIAPSPTGFLHVGTARSALFNYLFARQNKGKFYLRIEDTDKLRSKKKFIADIQEGLEWLGLQVGGEVVFQSQRLGLYREAVAQLQTSGWAYEKDGALYFNVRRAGETRSQIEFDDLVRGLIRINCSEIEDFVIVRSDGSPVFHLAVVVDDAAMGVTHVIRGDDMLSNTPKHILIGEALGYPIPHYAHLPLILSPDRAKLSKRHGAISLNEYRRQGYLPEAMVNFLALLGWHPSDDREYFTLDELIAEFSLERIQKGGAIFDEVKLTAMNRHYIQTLPTKILLDHLAPLTAHAKDQKFAQAFELVKERLTHLNQFDTETEYLWNQPTVDPKLLVFKKSTVESTSQGLAAVIEVLEKITDTDWQQEKIQLALEQIVATEDLSNGDVFWSSRVALSGREASPPPAAIAAFLGKEETLARLRAAAKTLNPKL